MWFLFFKQAIAKHTTMAIHGKQTLENRIVLAIDEVERGNYLIFL